MNERIEKLAVEARQYAFGEVENSQDPTEWSTKYYNEMFEQKFAELIVRECADLFRLTFTDEQYQRRIDKTILNHFGVEETKREKFRNSFEEAFKDGVDLSGRNTP
jgi:hypothetical protein